MPERPVKTPERIVSRYPARYQVREPQPGEMVTLDDRGGLRGLRAVAAGCGVGDTGIGRGRHRMGDRLAAQCFRTSDGEALVGQVTVDNSLKVSVRPAPLCAPAGSTGAASPVRRKRPDGAPPFTGRRTESYTCGGFCYSSSSSVPDGDEARAKSASAICR